MEKTTVATMYIHSVVSSMKTLEEFICSENNADTVYRLVSSMLQLEQTEGYNLVMSGFDYECPNETKSCRIVFSECNQKAVKKLEKFLLQGYRFEELISTLKQENSTLSEEIRLG